MCKVMMVRIWFAAVEPIIVGVPITHAWVVKNSVGKPLCSAALMSSVKSLPQLLVNTLSAPDALIFAT